MEPGGPLLKPLRVHLAEIRELLAGPLQQREVQQAGRRAGAPLVMGRQRTGRPVRISAACAAAFSDVLSFVVLDVMIL